MSAATDPRVDGRVAVARHVHTREFDGDLIILDLNGGEYFALSAVGAAMWHELVKGRTPAEVGLALAATYDVGQDKLVDDCAKLVDELLRRGLVTRCPS